MVTDDASRGLPLRGRAPRKVRAPFGRRPGTPRRDWLSSASLGSAVLWKPLLTNALKRAPLLSCALLGACATQPRAATPAAPDLALLAAWMTGSFSSTEQAAADPDNFRDVRLHMTPIWQARRDGPWLYVEQAMASTPDRPYRQRVYRLSRGTEKNTFTSAVYELPGDPLVFAGAWRTPTMLDAVMPENLSPREGCTITLRFKDDAFRGSTAGAGCVSTLRGAAYATSEVVITSTMIVSWDRGFDAEGNQKWGAEKGGYVFLKEE